jgi:hypothetical protein
MPKKNQDSGGRGGTGIIWAVYERRMGVVPEYIEPLPGRRRATSGLFSGAYWMGIGGGRCLFLDVLDDVVGLYHFQRLWR